MKLELNSEVELATKEDLLMMHADVKNLIELLTNSQGGFKDELLTTQQVMEYLKISKRFLQSLRNEGKIKFCQNEVRGPIKYRLSEVRKYMDRITVN
jgi:hypothetical protein